MNLLWFYLHIKKCTDITIWYKKTPCILASLSIFQGAVILVKRTLEETEKDKQKIDRENRRQKLTSKQNELEIEGKQNDTFYDDNSDSSVFDSGIEDIR